MRDPYLYEGTRVLKNKLGIVSQAELDRAEADYVSWRLKQLVMNPLVAENECAKKTVQGGNLQ